MVSVSIVTYHTPTSELDTCLSSLNSKHVSRIYIVDNSQSDRICQWATSHPSVIYIPSKNRGYGAGHNQAILRECQYDSEDKVPYHLVMNSDLTFNPETIDVIESYMDAHPDIGTIQPRIIGPNSEPQYTCRCLPTPLDVFIRRFLPSKWFISKRDHYLLKHLDLNKAWNIPYHQGSFMFMRKTALKKAGLFDENFFMYPEDIDLTRRIHRYYSTVYWPGATIVHYHRASSYHSMRMLWIHIINMIRYFNKWGWIHDYERSQFNRNIKEYSSS